MQYLQLQHQDRLDILAKILEGNLAQSAEKMKINFLVSAHKPYLLDWKLPLAGLHTNHMM